MRFLKYSIDKQKPIKVVILSDQTMKQLTIRVLRLCGDGFYYTISTHKKEHFCKYIDLLASNYARGDEEAKL